MFNVYKVFLEYGIQTNCYDIKAKSYGDIVRYFQGEARVVLREQLGAGAPYHFEVNDDKIVPGNK